MKKRLWYTRGRNRVTRAWERLMERLLGQALDRMVQRRELW